LSAIFVRLLTHEEKDTALAEAIQAVSRGEQADGVYLVEPAAFRQVPGAPFAYWVSERVRRLFTELPPFEGEGRTVRQGLATADDFRFVRAWWEVAPERILDAANGPDWREDLEAFQEWCRKRTFEAKRWVPFAKGGEYSPYYADIHLVVNWENDGSAVKSYIVERYPYLGGNWQWVVKNTGYYFRPGLTFRQRPHRCGSFAALPAGCIFSTSGQAALAAGGLHALLAMMNSTLVTGLVLLCGGRGQEGSGQTIKFEAGMVSLVPVPSSLPAVLGSTALKAYRFVRALCQPDETTLAFAAPAITMLRSEDASVGEQVRLAERSRCATIHELAEIQAGLDDLTQELYDLSEADYAMTVADIPSSAERWGGRAGENDRGVPNDFVEGFLQWLLGAVFGRWDARMAMNPELVPQLQDAFCPLPVCPPAMLVGPDGLPAKPDWIASEEWLRARPDAAKLPPEGSVKKPAITQAEYPLRVDWDGILVDDEGHPDDIVQRVRDVLALVFGERAEAIEHEACEILGVRSLRDYFRKQFFDFHIKRYSKSRRKAPIYWYLTTRRKSYGLWLYYHRLTRDTLYLAVQRYVEPKLNHTRSRMSEVKSRLDELGQGAPRREKRRLEREFEDLEKLEAEVVEFREALQRVIALGYEPDLDDGVIINIAPLHEVVPWREAEKMWRELLAGKYEWSSMSKRLRERGLL